MIAEQQAGCTQCGFNTCLCEGSPNNPDMWLIIEGLLAALRKIETLEPGKYEYPANWSENIASCAECQSYANHPIQRGICDTHRRPIWAREAFDKSEEARLGYRAKEIAREAREATLTKGGLQ